MNVDIEESEENWDVSFSQMNPPIRRIADRVLGEAAAGPTVRNVADPDAADHNGAAAGHDAAAAGHNAAAAGHNAAAAGHNAAAAGHNAVAAGRNAVAVPIGHDAVAVPVGHDAAGAAINGGNHIII